MSSQSFQQSSVFILIDWAALHKHIDCKLFELLVGETLNFKSQQYLKFEITLILTLSPVWMSFIGRAAEVLAARQAGRLSSYFQGEVAFLVCPKSPTLILSQEVLHPHLNLWPKSCSPSSSKRREIGFKWRQTSTWTSQQCWEHG